MEKQIFTVGFEGCHRSGKGTQIELLSEYLWDIGVPNMKIRGDGSRPNSGEFGDTYSPYWQTINPILKRGGATPEMWLEASERICRELLVYKNRIFPRLLNHFDSHLGVMLIDRTILSRTMVPREMGGDIYRNIEIESIAPDIVFCLYANKDTLLERLDPLDPKYAFRKSVIERTSDWYRDFSLVPEVVQKRIVLIDAAQSIEDVRNIIQATIGGHLEL